MFTNVALQLLKLNCMQQLKVHSEICRLHNDAKRYEAIFESSDLAPRQDEMFTISQLVTIAVKS